jgi:tRNA dimethylallyltransferase
MAREELYRRVDQRIDSMIAEGWVQEVDGLLCAGLPLDAPSMSAIGYREMAAHVRGELALDEALSRIRRATRRLIRHQYNWFRLTDPRIRWFDAGPSSPEEITSTVRSWLTTGECR